MRNNEREDAAVVSALQTTIVTGNEVDESVLSAAHGLREEGDEPLVWKQEGEVVQIEHHHSQRCADGQRALHCEGRHEGRYLLTKRWKHTRRKKAKRNGEGRVVLHSFRVGGDDEEHFVLQTTTHKRRIRPHFLRIVFKGESVQYGFRRFQQRE